MPVREEAQVFGPEGSHVGILTQRGATARRRRSPA